MPRYTYVKFTLSKGTYNPNFLVQYFFLFESHFIYRYVKNVKACKNSPPDGFVVDVVVSESVPQVELVSQVSPLPSAEEYIELWLYTW